MSQIVQLQTPLTSKGTEAEYRAFAESLPTLCWMADADGAIHWYNQRWYDYTGKTPADLEGWGWQSVHDPEVLPSVLERWTGSIAQGQPFEMVFPLLRHDGVFKPFLTRIVPHRDASGAIIAWFGVNTDISDQVEAQEALEHLNVRLEDMVEARTTELMQSQEVLRQSQKMEAIGNLTGGVAHDFNNLLQVISGNLQLLARDVAGNERAERRVQNAMSGVSRGAKLAAQLLAFGRRQPLAPKVVNVGRLVRGMDDLLRRSLGEEIEIEAVVSGGLWNTKIDPGNIENAILNLAINARDAMKGAGHLTIEAGNASLDAVYAKLNPDVTPGQYVLLAVTDTGGGMTPAVLDKAFEPFFSTKPEGQGTGLGLSMVYGLVKQSGGHIKIYSEVGHGTTIKLYLPRSHENEDTLVSQATDVAESGHETVLVVEDDDDVRDTTVATLQDLGYKVLKANDAQSALNVIESGIAIDVLFTDVVMPGPLKSPELARKAVERLPNIVVLFTSGYTQNAIVHGGRLDQGVELLSKPYTREALASRIRHLLSGRRAAAR